MRGWLQSLGQPHTCTTFLPRTTRCPPTCGTRTRDYPSRSPSTSTAVFAWSTLPTVPAQLKLNGTRTAVRYSYLLRVTHPWSGVRRPLSGTLCGTSCIAPERRYTTRTSTLPTYYYLRWGVILVHADFGTKRRFLDHSFGHRGQNHTGPVPKDSTGIGLSVELLVNGCSGRKLVKAEFKNFLGQLPFSSDGPFHAMEIRWLSWLAPSASAPLHATILSPSSCLLVQTTGGYTLPPARTHPLSVPYECRVYRTYIFVLVVVLRWYCCRTSSAGTYEAGRV